MTEKWRVEDLKQAVAQHLKHVAAHHGVFLQLLVELNYDVIELALLLLKRVPVEVKLIVLVKRREVMEIQPEVEGLNQKILKLSEQEQWCIDSSTPKSLAPLTPSHEIEGMNISISNFNLQNY